MPGRVSLEAQQYYAHPRNLFWDLMARLFGFDREAPYGERVAALLREGIALWDVLRSCTRSSSLDSDIIDSSVVVNGFGSFLAAHPAIKTVCFNGAKAETSYRRHVLPEVEGTDLFTYYRLPSTSPANASIPLNRKLNEWQVVRSAV